MNVILFNLFNIPPYLKTCIKQIQHTNPDVNIHLITDKNIQNAGKVKCYNVNDFAITPQLSRKIKFYKDNNVRYLYELFLSSAVRFCYINELCTKLKLDNIFTFDNDVLIYGKFSEFVEKIGKNHDYAITQSVKNEFICGMSYFKKYTNLTPIAGDFESFMMYSSDELKKLFGGEFKRDFVSEMSLLYYINEKRNLNFFVLPSDPKESVSGLIFDPITYGQVLDGVSPYGGGNGTPHFDTNHILYPKLMSTEIVVKYDEKNKLPIAENLPLFNLHVHSKNLDKFKSYE